MSDFRIPACREAVASVYANIADLHERLAQEMRRLANRQSELAIVERQASQEQVPVKSRVHPVIAPKPTPETHELTLVPSSPSPDPRVPAATGPVASRIQGYLLSQGHPVSLGEICEALPDITRGSLSGILSRGLKTGYWVKAGNHHGARWVYPQLTKAQA